MYETRQPITAENFSAHLARTLIEDKAPPHVSAIATDPEGQMTEFYRENPGCTEDDLIIAGFDPGHVTRYGKSAAARAARLSLRRVA